MADFTPTEAAILDMLSRRRKGFTLSEIAEGVGTTPNCAKVIIHRLRRKGCAIVSPRHTSRAGPRKGIRQAYVLGEAGA